MNLTIQIATVNEAAAIARLLNDAADHLTGKFGKGHWSYHTSEKSVVNAITGKSKIIIALNGQEIAGSYCLQTKKPWAIDPAFFTPVEQALYLVGMAVSPAWQQKGIGRYMMQELPAFITQWPAQAVRLDAYDHAAGAGDFYRKNGFTERGRVLYRGNPLIYFERLV